jgi:hypothetical protein
MYFRFFHVSEVIFHDLNEKGEVVFRPGDGYEITIRALTNEEIESVKIYYMSGYAVMVDLERGVPRKSREIFEALANRKLPEGMGQEEENKQFFNEDGTIKDEFYDGGGLRLAIALAGFDNAFQTFVKDVTTQITDYTDNFIRTLRWRGNGSGPNNPIRASRLPVWSFDKTTWHILPQHQEPTIFQHTSMLHTTDDIKSDVEKYLKNGIKESLAHELLYEAWNQRGESPRGALILAIAAVEIGVKQCITLLAPDTEWLFKTFQSPPVVRLLEEYLPTLPARCKVNNKVLPPTAETIQHLKKGVKLRNEAVHGIPQGLTQESLREILLAAQDTIWLLEFYSGYKWAWEYIATHNQPRSEEL